MEPNWSSANKDLPRFHMPVFLCTADGELKREIYTRVQGQNEQGRWQDRDGRCMPLSINGADRWMEAVPALCM